jgi:subtilisin family serine protease
MAWSFRSKHGKGVILKRNNIKIRVLLIWGIIWSMCSMLVFAAVGGKPAFGPANKGHATSNRLIVKFKPGKAERVMSAEQRHAEMSQPLAADVILQLQYAAGAQLSDLHVTGTGAHVMTLAGTQGTETVALAVAGIRKLPNVEYVEEDAIETIQAVPNDTNYPTGPTGNPGLWGMWPVTAVAGTAPGRTGSYGADFQTAWDTTTGSGVVVAVVDSGITPHPDIVGPSGVVAASPGSNLVSDGYNFITDCRTRGTCAATTADASAGVPPVAGASDTGDFITSADISGNPHWSKLSVSSSTWHGTHVAGTIAAIGNNSLGVIGGAYGAKILPVRALGKGGGYSSDVSNAIMWAAGVYPGISNPNPAKVINLSTGSTSTCSTDRINAINAAVNAGAVVVVAAGNEDADVATSKSANCPNVISVAAVARDGSRATYSNFSSPATNTTNPVSVTLAAQGGDQSSYYSPSFEPGILSTLNTGTTTPLVPTYAYYQGTSMATPHVSAAAALVLSRNPTLTPAQVKSILSASTSVTAFPTFIAGLAPWDCALHSNCGAGILNAALAVQYSLVADASPANFGSVTSGGTVTKTVTWTNATASSVTLSDSASIAGTNSSFFTIASSTCNTPTIGAGGTCAVTLKYAPTSSGSHSAVLIVPSTPHASGVSLVGTANAPAPSGGGGGGCAIMPFSASPDVSLLIAMLAVGAYWLRRRTVRNRGAA